MANILIVEDEANIRDTLKQILEDEGHQVVVAGNGNAARAAYQAQRFDLLLLDIWMPDIDGLSLLTRWNQEGQRTMPVIIMSAFAEASYKARMAHLGVASFLSKPMSYLDLTGAVEQVLASPQTRLEVHVPGKLNRIAGESAAIHTLERRLAELALNRAPVLISLEPGSPALECARIIADKDATFVELTRMERLYAAPIDILVEARGGTLFIANVAALDHRQQAGLKIVLHRCGEYGVRVICASTVPLGMSVNDSNFSAEVYAAICDNAVRIPPLRERLEDIQTLVERWLHDQTQAEQRNARSLTPAAIRQLQIARPWAGNEAELHRQLTGLLLLCDKDCLDERDVRQHMGIPQEPVGNELTDLIQIPMKEAVDSFRRLYLMALLKQFEYNKSALAAYIGMDRTSVHTLMRRLGIPLNPVTGTVETAAS